MEQLYTYSTTSQFIPNATSVSPLVNITAFNPNLFVQVDCLDYSDIAVRSYNPTFIRFETSLYQFKKALNCKVFKKNHLFFCEYSPLLLKVWGNSYEEVIEAFNFAFHSLYINFCRESDSKLSKDAIRLKDKLKDLVLLAF